jgi:G protein-coupled receptor 125
MNMTFTPKTLLESARQFLNFTDDPGVFRDEMDLVYFSRAVGNYLPYLERIGGVGDLGHYMLSMVENAMDVGSARLAAQSQLRDHAMERLLHVVNNVTAFLPSFQHHTNKLAVEAYDIRPVNFDGVTCTWYESLSTAYQRFSPKRVFHCAETNKTLPTRGKVVLASVALPKSIYGQIMSVHQQYEDDNKSRRDGRRNRNRNLLVFSTYNNATLFPTTVPEPRFEDVSSLVIGVQHGELHYEEFGNLADPVNIVIQSAAIPDHPKLQVQPVWWDASANNGFGSWRSDYCQLVEAKASLVWFKCWRLGHYGYRLMSPGLIYESHHARFRFHHPLVYIGSFCCIGLIVSAVVIYAISFHSIMISRKLKHALVNIWVASSSLVFLFVTGIHQTENDAVCKGVGVAAHYLTLCSLVWLVVSVSIIYKKANSQKLSQSSRQNNAAFLDRGNQNRNESSNSRFRQPISRLYLIGWGISALVCAISAAFDIDNYGTPTHCFMKLVPFLAGVVLPLALLTGTHT